MTTTLFAIFAIAVVATLAWVITRIVNIFVELQELKKQAEDITERMNWLQDVVDKINHTIALNLETIDNFHKILNDVIESYEKRPSTQVLEKHEKDINDLRTELMHVVANTSKTSEAQEAKQARLEEFSKAREEGKTIRQAGEAVGVSYPTAKRYEKQRKAQSNETVDN